MHKFILRDQTQHPSGRAAISILADGYTETSLNVEAASESSLTKAVAINVACEYRLELYKHFLGEAKKEIDNYFLSELLGSHFIKNAVYDGRLFSTLAQLFDQEILPAIDADLSSISKFKEMCGRASGLDIAAARKELIDYYYRSKEFQIEDFFERHPRLHAKLSVIKDNFVHNITKILRRTLRHRIVLAQDFLNLPPEQILLKRIVSTGSDCHKDGQQTMILEFCQIDLPDAVCGRVVYKPSTIEPDRRLVANTRFEADKLSLFEMVNQYLPDKYKLKTYRIFPCRTEPIQDAYGFLEYLPHNPWPEIDYVKEMGRLYQEFSVTMPGKINWLAIREELKADYADYLLPQDAAGIDGVGAFSSYFTTKFELELKKLYLDLRARNKASDFVVETDEEVECYSYQCGIITAIARIFGISDIHVQNFIISGKLPCLIDTEVSFRPDLFSIRNIGCLWGTGAMRKDAIYPHLPGRVLYDSSGLLAELSGIREIEKNRLYRLYRLSDDNSLIACGPTREKFVGGFNRALDIIKEHADEFFSWIHSDVVRNTWVRVVPCDTEELGVMVQYYWLGDVDVFWRLHENDILQRTIIKITDSDKTFFIPNFLALRKKWIERDLSRCSIPIFYIRVKDITPVDSRGRRVLVDYSDIRKRLQSGLKGGSHGAILSALSFENPERYYKKSGEEKIHENITQLTQDPNFTQELQSELIENLTFDLDYTSVTEPPRVGDEVMVATSDDVEKIKCCSSCVCQ